MTRQELVEVISKEHGYDRDAAESAAGDLIDMADKQDATIIIVPPWLSHADDLPSPFGTGLIETRTDDGILVSGFQPLGDRNQKPQFIDFWDGWLPKRHVHTFK